MAGIPAAGNVKVTSAESEAIFEKLIGFKALLMMRYFIRSSTYHILSHLQNADSENVFFFYPIALINTRPVH